MWCDSVNDYLQRFWCIRYGYEVKGQAAKNQLFWNYYLSKRLICMELTNLIIFDDRGYKEFVAQYMFRQDSDIVESYI